MDLFEKVVEVKEIKEKADQKYKELRDSLRSQFVDLPYELKEVEANYPRNDTNDRDNIKVYYPILNVPEGFKKEDEKFYREYANCINREYTLIDEKGRKVTIVEQVTFTDLFTNNEKYWLQLKFNIPSSEITFSINVLGEQYKFKRIIKQNALIKEVIGENNIVKYEGTWHGRSYDEEEKKYEEFLETLGRTKEIVTLKELANKAETRIDISETFNATVKSNTYVTNESTIWLEGGMYRIGLDNVNSFSIKVKIKPYYNNSIEIAEKRFEYVEIENEEKLRKGMTLDEIFEMLQK